MEKTLSDDKEFFERCVRMRGFFIEYISALEYSLNTYLSEYFCGENKSKSEDMQLLILGDDRMSLSAKAQVFHHIAKNHDTDWYESYQAYGKSMNADLVKAIEERNIFAHRIADVDFFIKNDLPIGTVRFIKFKNSIEAIEYNDDKFNKLLNMTMNLIKHFGNKLG